MGYALAKKYIWVTMSWVICSWIVICRVFGQYPWCFWKLIWNMKLMNGICLHITRFFSGYLSLNVRKVALEFMIFFRCNLEMSVMPDMKFLKMCCQHHEELLLERIKDAGWLWWGIMQCFSVYALWHVLGLFICILYKAE